MQVIFWSTSTENKAGEWKIPQQNIETKDKNRDTLTHEYAKASLIVGE